MHQEYPLQVQVGSEARSYPSPPAYAATRVFSPGVVASLDVARALAAMYVVLHHVALARGWQNIPHFGFVFKLGQEAVVAFFLLSGVVIFANERARAVRQPLRYALRRARRIYPGLVCALMLSTLVCLDNHTLREAFSGSELMGTLLGLQDVAGVKPGVIVAPYLGNEPLWSLSYELVFYAAFPFIVRVWLHTPRLTDHAVGAVCCLAYVGYVLHPNHWCLVTAYFLVWWAGAMAADAYLSGKMERVTIGPSAAWLCVLTAIAGAAVVIVGRRSLYDYPVLPLRHFATALLALFMVGGPVGRVLMRACRPVAPLAAGAASISYGVYILHYPLLVQSHRSATVAGLIGMFGVMLALAALVDLWLNRVLPRVPEQRSLAATVAL